MALPPPLEIDLELMLEVVYGAAWTTLAPVSSVCPAPAKDTPMNSARARSPRRMLMGYNMDTLEPKEPEIHSMAPSLSTRARLVFRLNMLRDQFSMVL